MNTSATKTVGLLGGVLVYLAAQPAVAQTRHRNVAVPTDPRATYQILEQKLRPSGRWELMVQRQGPSGVSFTRREIDCRQHASRYLGEGDTIEEARQNRPEPRLARAVAGSISWYLIDAGCASRTDR